MKKTLMSILCTTGFLLNNTHAAVTYPDAIGDFTPSGFGYLDITSVVVDNDLTTLSFQINLAGNPLAVDWAKYLIVWTPPPGATSPVQTAGASPSP